MAIYKISGSNSFGKRVEKYYVGDRREAEKTFLEVPPGEGGITSWSVEELEELPKQAFICCPHCSKELRNPVMVVEL